MADVRKMASDELIEAFAKEAHAAYMYRQYTGPLDMVRAELLRRLDAQFLIEVIRVANKHDRANDLLWHEDENGKLSCAVMCSDTFFWGCADAEDVTPESLPIYKQTVEECEALEESLPKGSHMFPCLYAGELFAARMRKMRPQGASYEMYPPIMWPLFDACGPYREKGMGNPHPQPTDAEKWEAKFQRRTSDKEKLAEALAEIERLKGRLDAPSGRFGEMEQSLAKIRDMIQDFSGSPTQAGMLLGKIAGLAQITLNNLAALASPRPASQQEEP